jgi:hypothetical protein
MEKNDKKGLRPKVELTPLELLGIVGKGAVGISTVFYLIGFVVVNVYLSRFSYYSENRLSAHYLIAGIWALAPILAGWVFFLYIAFRFMEISKREIDNGDRSKRAVTRYLLSIAVIVLILGTVGSCFVLLQFREWIARLSLESKWGVFIVLGFFSSLPILVLFWYIYDPNEPLSSIKPKWIPLTVTLTFIAALFFWVYITAFSHHLYGDIPATWGGGQPRLVRLIVKSEARDDLISVGINFPSGLNTSDALNLILATEKEYVFLIDNADASISIRRDIVQAVVYEKH